MTSSRRPAVLLAVSTVIGSAAWFLPPSARTLCAVTAALVALWALAEINHSLRVATAVALALLPAVLGVAAVAAIFIGATITGRSDLWVLGAIVALAGIVRLSHALRPQRMAHRTFGSPFRWLDRLEDRLWSPKPAPVLERLEELTELAEKHAASLDELRRQNEKLQLLVDQLRTEIAAAALRDRRSSLLSFWGGVALSIPIGVLINLATG